MRRTLFSLAFLALIVPACVSEEKAQNQAGRSELNLRVSEGADSVDLNHASLSWDWTPGSGGEVRKFLVRCVTLDGRSLTLHPLEASARTVPLKQVIGGPGRYRCVVTAESLAGELRATNEVRFRAVDESARS